MPTDRYAEDAIRLADCRRRTVRHVQCRSCGYEPPRHAVPIYCPKCRGGCWESFVQMGKLRPGQGDGSAEVGTCDAGSAGNTCPSSDVAATPQPIVVSSRQADITPTAGTASGR